MLLLIKIVSSRSNSLAFLTGAFSLLALDIDSSKVFILPIISEAGVSAFISITPELSIENLLSGFSISKNSTISSIAFLLIIFVVKASGTDTVDSGSSTKT